jgi:hypothetical protein
LFFNIWTIFATQLYLFHSFIWNFRGFLLILFPPFTIVHTQRRAWPRLCRNCGLNSEERTEDYAHVCYWWVTTCSSLIFGVFNLHICDCFLSDINQCLRSICRLQFELLLDDKGCMLNERWKKSNKLWNWIFLVSSRHEPIYISCDIVFVHVGGTLGTRLMLRPDKYPKGIDDPDRNFGRESRCLKAAYELMQVWLSCCMLHAASLGWLQARDEPFRLHPLSLTRVWHPWLHLWQCLYTFIDIVTFSEVFPHYSAEWME